ncbi:MAG TPA: helix-turn-helix domain-containing protein [Syntrophorhabdus sp.]|jgi:transcriptional regulator with GAF, ATPase, and Fis domain|nr:helix-turn-helix domain-containing protein [Pseudomonadota bacterium]HNY70355.1 helix-turn-helix domain-containing protein [Syntrophorhabdus sp.]
MQSLDEIRLKHILQVLEKTGWDMKKASEILKVPERVIKKQIRILKPIAIKKP